MRNYLTYPLTNVEIVQVLRAQAEALRFENRFGDSRPLALEKAAKIIEDAAKLFDGVNVLP